MSIDSILFLLKSSSNKDLNEEIAKMKSDFENTSSLNLKKLETGFKTAKLIFVSTFVILVLYMLDITTLILALSVFVLFFAVVELKNIRSTKIKLISFFSGIINLIYLASLAISRFLIR